MKKAEFFTDKFIAELWGALFDAQPKCCGVFAFAYPDEETEENVRKAKMFYNRILFLLYMAGEIKKEDYLKSMYIIY